MPGIPDVKCDSGTSQAAPHVTGVAALLWSRAPELTYLQVRNQLLSTVRKVPALAGKTVTGGVVDAYRAVLWDCEGDCENPLCQNVGPDCNGNGVYDGCDIASGASCDENGDTVPDECGACCAEDFSCETVSPDLCPSPATFYRGVRCDECSCLASACCDGTTCCDFVPGCECLSRKGSPNPGTYFCSSTTCENGACCTSSGCQDVANGVLMTKAACDSQGGEFFGGQRCKGGLCSDNFTSCPSNADCNGGVCNGDEERAQTSPCHRRCPLGTIDAVGSRPPDYTTYARYPHQPDDPLVALGIGDPGGREEDRIKIRLALNGSGVSGADLTECWCLCETHTHPDLGPNHVTCVEHLGGGTYEIHLARAITSMAANVMYSSGSGEDAAVTFAGAIAP